MVVLLKKEEKKDPVSIRQIVDDELEKHQPIFLRMHSTFREKKIETVICHAIPDLT